MRTIQNLFLAIILLSLIACKPDRPEGVLSEEKMIDVLVDMHLAEGVMSVSRVRQQFHMKKNLSFLRKKIKLPFKVFFPIYLRLTEPY